ncbi:12S seed storage globulin [Thalictrum thalictroides]|uniref:12S seed storage globulin n=1 Tax=Thalictrum thalictroides TaxID=46969 RepID=A0A7J6WAX8_THATH|nr:12S seed storage globulin [Thalictrum thalictroides]
MAKLSLLFSLSVCFLLLFHAQALIRHQSQGQGKYQQCQLHNIDALEPTRKIQSEAGVTEHWDDNNEQLDCAGVSVTRYVIEPKGLLLPHYHNAPKLTYVSQG